MTPRWRSSRPSAERIRIYHPPPTRKSISHWRTVKPCGPHHCDRCSGCVHTLKTSARGASKTRVMTSSRDDSVAAVLVAGILLLLLLHLAQIFFETIETLLPETPIVFDPLGGILERARLEPARTPLRLAPARDEPRALQYLEMLGNRGKAHLEGLGEFGDRGLAGREAREDRATSGIGKRCEGRAELIGCEFWGHLW